jgi:hypothetical protein
VNDTVTVLPVGRRVHARLDTRWTRARGGNERSVRRQAYVGVAEVLVRAQISGCGRTVRR